MTLRELKRILDAMPAELLDKPVHLDHTGCTSECCVVIGNAVDHPTHGPARVVLAPRWQPYFPDAGYLLLQGPRLTDEVDPDCDCVHCETAREARRRKDGGR